MGLIESNRYSERDLDVWRRLEGYDRRLADSKEMRRRTRRAMEAMASFIDRTAYVGVSWGKDSMVVAHMARVIDPSVTLAWIRVEPIANPDCAAVRDVFLARYPGAYIELEEQCTHDADGWHAKGTLERGFRRVCRQLDTTRYVSGIRGEESGMRKLRGKLHGIETKNTCAPLIWWRHEHVFAYLSKHALPVHPAYACSMGGMISRGHLRVASLGGERGTGVGRREWERRYYPGLVGDRGFGFGSDQGGAQMSLLGDAK